MRKIIVLLSLFFIIKTAYPQSPAVDSILKKIAVEKDEDKKVDLIVSIWATGLDRDPDKLIQTGQVLLKQAQADHDIIKEASAYSFLGTGYRISGNPIRALQVHQKGLQLAEKANNFSLLGLTKNQMTHTYRDREEWENAFKGYTEALIDAVKGKNEVIKIWPVLNLGNCYLNINRLDSALKYLQSAYEKSLVINKVDLPFILWNLGAVHSKMNNGALAVSYFNMSAQMAKDAKRLRQLCFAYTGLGEHYQRISQRDSSIFYLKQALLTVLHTPFFFMSVKPAKILAELYEKSNCDSTLKYAGIYKVANDSVFSNKINQQIQVMTFDEKLRQQEIASAELKANEERKNNLQYAAIGFSLISFIILFLLFSHSIIANEKVIRFLGVVALLLVFEFINLFIHPFIGELTHHSPLLMLLIMVFVAALLVPAHHQLEHWITHKMVEKNKKIRLAAAKKTIATLEGEQTN